MAFKPNQVMNGTWGEVWINGDIFAEVTAFQAKDEYSKVSVPQVGNMSPGQKVTAVDGKGAVTMHKVNSKMAKMIGKQVREGKTPVFTIIAKLADPDAQGAERYSFTGCVFDDLTLADWEVGSLGKTTHPFTYQDYEPLDEV